MECVCCLVVLYSCDSYVCVCVCGEGGLMLGVRVCASVGCGYGCVCVLGSEAMFVSVMRVCDCFSVSVHVACRLIYECIHVCVCMCWLIVHVWLCVCVCVCLLELLGMVFVTVVCVWFVLGLYCCHVGVCPQMWNRGCTWCCVCVCARVCVYVCVCSVRDCVCLVLCVRVFVSMSVCVWIGWHECGACVFK